nr:PAS domain S-box protein [uncultured Allomuricauda sp.]
MKSIETVPQNYILKQLPKATAFVDKNYSIVDASDSWLHLFNFKWEDLSGKSILNVFTDHEQLTKTKLKEYLDSNKRKKIQHVQVTKEDETWYESILTPWFDEKENVVGTILQSENISKRIEKELELKRTKILLKAKSEVAKVGSWEYDLISQKLSWCDQTKKIHEVPKSFVPTVSQGIDFYKQGYSRNKVSMLFHKILEDGTPYSQRLIIITAKGEEKWVEAGGKAMKKNGEIVKIIGTFQDINDQVIAEKKTKESEQLLSTLIDNLPINVYIKDKESRKLLVNKTECEYIGTNAKNLIGKSDFDLYDKKIAQISRDEDLEVMRSLKPMVGVETINIKKDGSSTNFLTSKIPLINSNGEAYGLIGMSMDITHIKEKEDELRNLINITAIQNKKLTNFAHIVSHNLRSHTANFSMLLDFLIHEKEEKEKDRIMTMLTHASDNLLDTLENLNDVVAISTNVNIDKKPLNLKESILKVQQNLAAFLEKNKVEFVNHVPNKLSVLSVPAYLESIVLNLVTNAVKYSNPKRNPLITLRAKKQDNSVVLSVEDNGLGIDLNKYGGKIFGMYKTFHNKKDARGLGLYIIKNQIEAMGGSITVNSEVGKGTTFNVYFNEEDK